MAKEVPRSAEATSARLAEVQRLKEEDRWAAHRATVDRLAVSPDQYGVWVRSRDANRSALHWSVPRIEPCLDKRPGSRVRRRPIFWHFCPASLHRVDLSRGSRKRRGYDHWRPWVARVVGRHEPRIRLHYMY